MSLFQLNKCIHLHKRSNATNANANLSVCLTWELAVYYCFSFNVQLHLKDMPAYLGSLKIKCKIYAGISIHGCLGYASLSLNPWLGDHHFLRDSFKAAMKFRVCILPHKPRKLTGVISYCSAANSRLSHTEILPNENSGENNWQIFSLQTVSVFTARVNHFTG